MNNYIFTNKDVLYRLMEHPELPTVEVENPKQEAYSCLRTWMTPQILQTLSRSKHADYPQRIFEVGDVVMPDDSAENRAREERRLAAAIAGAKVTFTDVHALVDSIMRSLGLTYRLERHDHPSLIPGRSVTVKVEGVEVGFAGEVHPKVLENWDLKVPVAVLEVDVSKIREILLRSNS